MPEDQNYDGDIWNKEAGELLKAFHWSQIGDYDMDIKDVGNVERGVDTLFDYNLFSNFSKSGFVLEAKSYKAKTFFSNTKLLEEWIEILYRKIKGIAPSEELQNLFPQTCNTIFKDGLIVIWFKDTENYNSQKFFSLYEKIKFSKSSRGITRPCRLFVLENSNILRLLSLEKHIREICYNENDFVFHYPSDYQSNSVVHSNVLSVEFMFSKFILGELRNKEGKTLKKVVFYFGNINIKNFYRLKSAISKLQFLNRDCNLLIFSYQRDQDFRKYYPEIRKLFVKELNDNESQFEFLEMDKLGDLPSWITSLKY